jgi:hypothetical protein
MIITLIALNCLMDIKAHEQEVVDYLPGNESTLEFTSCLGQSVGDGGVADATGRWTVSQVNSMGILWSYSGKVYAHVEANKECEVTSVDVTTKPSNWLLKPALEQAEEVIYKHFSKVIKEKPEYRVICGHGAT